MTDKEGARSASRRLAIIRHAREVSGNVSQTCRYYGSTRQSYYVWLRRYVEKGVPASRIARVVRTTVRGRPAPRSSGGAAECYRCWLERNRMKHGLAAVTEFAHRPEDPPVVLAQSMRRELLHLRVRAHEYGS